MNLTKRYIAEDTSVYSSDNVTNKICLTGTEGLSDAQLLSVFINTRSKTESPLTIAQDILGDNARGLNQLVLMDVDAFTRFTGLSKSAFVKFKAAIELDRRRVYLQLGETDTLTSPNLVREFLARQLAGVEHEVFCGLLLDNRHRVIEYREFSRGTIDSAAVYPREVLKQCLSCNSCAVIFAHNHPSGVADPSDTDIRLTRKLTDALALIDIRVLDHLIIGQGVQTSLAERGLM